jgi:hypothetical protein
VPEQPLSLDMQARELIATSLSASEKALAAGHSRQAVQESLWLLETISTAFRGTESPGGGSIQGAYFNKIIRELRQDQSRAARTEILKWMMTLQGFLSSPTGGGVRHGIDLTEGAEAIGIHEARLYCNLIRSCVAFLISEHERTNSR